MMIGDRIKAERKALKMTQQDLGDKSSVSREAVSQWERGDSKGLRPLNLIMACKALGNLNPEWLVTGKGDKYLHTTNAIQEKPAAYSLTPREKITAKIIQMMPTAGMGWIKYINEIIDKNTNNPELTDSALYVELGKASNRIQMQWFRDEFDPAVAEDFFKTLGRSDTGKEATHEDLAEFVKTKLAKSS